MDNNKKLSKSFIHFSSTMIILFLISSIVFTVFALSVNAQIKNIGYTPQINRSSSNSEEIKSYVQPQKGILYKYYSFSGSQTINDASPYKNTMVIISQDDFLQVKTVMNDFKEYDELYRLDTFATILGRSTNCTREDLVYNHKNGTSKNDFLEDSYSVVLKAPIAPSTTWKSTDELTSTITRLDAVVTLGFGNFTAIEVLSTDGKGFERYDYYAKNLGNVMTVFKQDGVTTKTCYLEEISEDTIISKAYLYTYDINSNDVYVDMVDNAISTNPVYIEILENMLKHSLTSITRPLIQDKTYIQSVRIDRNNDTAYIDFSPNFLKNTEYSDTTEQIVLQSIADVTGNFYNIKYVVITSNGANKVGGHVDFSSPFYVELLPK